MLYNNRLKPTEELNSIWTPSSEESRKNKTYEQIFGSEKAEEMKQKQGNSRKIFFEKNPEEIEKIKKRSIGENNSFFGKKHTEETKSLISEKQKGVSLEQKVGKEKAKKLREKMSIISSEIMKNNPERKEQLANLIRGKTLEEIYGEEKGKEIREKRSKAIAKTYEGFCLISPEGEKFYEITNVSSFCRERGLTASHFRRVLSGHFKSHKGWKLDPTYIL